MKKKTLLDRFGSKFFVAYGVVMLIPVTLAIAFGHPELAERYLYTVGIIVTILFIAELVLDEIIKAQEREKHRRERDILLESIKHNQKVTGYYLDKINKRLS